MNHFDCWHLLIVPRTSVRALQTPERVLAKLNINDQAWGYSFSSRDAAQVLCDRTLITALGDALARHANELDVKDFAENLLENVTAMQDAPNLNDRPPLGVLPWASRSIWHFGGLSEDAMTLLDGWRCRTNQMGQPWVACCDHQVTPVGLDRWSVERLVAALEAEPSRRELDSIRLDLVKWLDRQRARSWPRDRSSQ